MLKTFSFLVVFSSAAFGQTSLGPWMDDKFGTAIRAKATDCNATIYDYDEVAQVNGWDCSADQGGLAWIEVARPDRVNTDLLKEARKDIKIPIRENAEGKKVPEVEAYEVGNPKTAEFAMIYVHGAGGDKRLAARDTNMGGNFNRLMNLVVRNNGVYYSPTVDFEDNGEGIQSIIEKLQKDKPGIKIVIACGSAGAATCRAVSTRTDSVKHLAGIMITGGAGSMEGITDSSAYKAGVPMIIAHGSRDGVDDPLDQFSKMRKRSDGSKYPVWMQVFNDGGHGTPIRLIDWKASLNWIFDQENEKKKVTKECEIPGFSPEISNLVTLSQKTKDLIASLTCEEFLKYPFIQSRDPNKDYTAKVKSPCVANKKEETPGEDLQIVPLK